MTFAALLIINQFVPYSYGRALQTSALRVWRTENPKEAQSAFLHRAKLNGLAAEGKYDEKFEKSVP